MEVSFTWHSKLLEPRLFCTRTLQNLILAGHWSCGRIGQFRDYFYYQLTFPAGFLIDGVHNHANLIFNLDFYLGRFLFYFILSYWVYSSISMGMKVSALSLCIFENVELLI
jgi:hypothetical protein